ncbi:hypothetical protein LXL04_020386 [Taraxacum kok-saghyz]
MKCSGVVAGPSRDKPPPEDKDSDIEKAYILPRGTYKLPAKKYETLDCPLSKNLIFKSIADYICSQDESEAALRFRRRVNHISWEHINSIIHEYEFIDAEHHPLFPNTPPLKEPNKSDEGIGDINKAVSLNPIIALVLQKKYKTISIWSSSYSKKNIFTLLTKLKSFMPQLRTIRLSLRKRTVFVDEVKWFMAVRKH